MPPASPADDRADNPAGNSATVRTRRIPEFAREMDDELDAVVATTAFGMGIDKPETRLAVHAEPADSVDSYYLGTLRQLRQLLGGQRP